MITQSSLFPARALWDLVRAKRPARCPRAPIIIIIIILLLYNSGASCVRSALHAVPFVPRRESEDSNQSAREHSFPGAPAVFTRARSNDGLARVKLFSVVFTRARSNDARGRSLPGAWEQTASRVRSKALPGAPRRSQAHGTPYACEPGWRSRSARGTSGAREPVRVRSAPGRSRTAAHGQQQQAATGRAPPGRPWQRQVPARRVGDTELLVSVSFHGPGRLWWLGRSSLPVSLSPSLSPCLSRRQRPPPPPAPVSCSASLRVPDPLSPWVSGPTVCTRGPAGLGRPLGVPASGTSGPRPALPLGLSPWALRRAPGPPPRCARDARTAAPQAGDA